MARVAGDRRAKRLAGFCHASGDVGMGFPAFEALHTRDEIRQAYFAQAKVYHPDRYATAELPTEVIEYLFAMARRITR